MKRLMGCENRSRPGTERRRIEWRAPRKKAPCLDGHCVLFWRNYRTALWIYTPPSIPLRKIWKCKEAVGSVGKKANFRTHASQTLYTLDPPLPRRNVPDPIPYS